MHIVYHLLLFPLQTNFAPPGCSEHEVHHTSERREYFRKQMSFKFERKNELVASELQICSFPSSSSRNKSCERRREIEAQVSQCTGHTAFEKQEEFFEDISNIKEPWMFPHGVGLLIYFNFLIPLTKIISLSCIRRFLQAGSANSAEIIMLAGWIPCRQVLHYLASFVTIIVGNGIQFLVELKLANQ